MVSVIIPALDEEKTIRKVITLVSDSPVVDEILVIDDKSFDNTIKQARLPKVRIYTSPMLGKGHSMRDGMMLAKNEVIVYLDADIITYPENVVELLSRPILNDEADFVKNENGELVLKKCELMEVSIVAVPSNANSVALYHSNGIQMTEKEIKNLTLSLGAATPPNPENFNQDNNSTMKKIQLSVLAFVALGFAKTTKEVDEAELDEAVLGLKAKIDENELELKKVKADLQAYKDAEKLALEGKITLAVDTAVKEGRITADLAQTYKDLGAQNFELMTKTLESFPKKVDLKAGVTTPSGTTEPMTEENFQKLSTEAQLAWKEANPEEYKKLFS